MKLPGEQDDTKWWIGLAFLGAAMIWLALWVGHSLSWGTQP